MHKLFSWSDESEENLQLAWSQVSEVLVDSYGCPRELLVSLSAPIR